jgi:hypothetical protein
LKKQEINKSPSSLSFLKKKKKKIQGFEKTKHSLNPKSRSGFLR